ncbi:hypothetical protein HLV40_00185 [Chromohalobacter salexigens]|nr:hypothetical protein [Chromohalobacter salexigens]
MKHYIVRPTTGRGWVLTLAFVVLIAAGIWPVIGWFNRACVVLGLPLIAVWAYVIVFACCGVMAIGNRLVERSCDDE